MRTKFLRITALLLLLIMVLSACGAPNDTTTESIEDTTTEAIANNDIYIERVDKEVKNILMLL